MARVFLLNPPSASSPVRTPLLSLCYLASSLRRRGHTVAVLDSAAPHAPHDPDAIEAAIANFGPDLVGLHLKTQEIQPAYALAERLAARLPGHVPLVAGGPHATVCPHEPFAHSFRYLVRGEGEDTLADLADSLDGRGRLEDIGSLSTDPRHHNPSRGFLLDLDALASPLDALDLFDPAWYSPAPTAATVVPAGLLSSRGCPAACTFCSNNVTGRRFRYRSAALIVDEIRRLQVQNNLRAFTFLDDSFAVGRRRVLELTAALATLDPPVSWTCTAHPAHLDRDILAAMKRAGCGGVDIGMESADPGMLLRIGKGVTVERVLEVLTFCAELGLYVMVNLMFGWPDETDAELGATLDFIHRAAPLASGFNSRGVLVPYPGTPIYDQHHERFGFTEWWVREPPLLYDPFPATWSPAEVKRSYASDPALARNFFRHPPHRIALIREALAAKAEYTINAIGRPSPTVKPFAAPGAR